MFTVYFLTLRFCIYLFMPNMRMPSQFYHYLLKLHISIGILNFSWIQYGRRVGPLWSETSWTFAHCLLGKKMSKVRNPKIKCVQPTANFMGSTTRRLYCTQNKERNARFSLHTLLKNKTSFALTHIVLLIITFLVFYGFK